MRAITAMPAGKPRGGLAINHGSANSPDGCMTLETQRVSAEIAIRYRSWSGLAPLSREAPSCPQLVPAR